MPTTIFVSRANRKVAVRHIGTARGKKNNSRHSAANGGGAIVKVDTSNKGRSVKEKKLDYNPIIKVPIGGV